MTLIKNMRQLLDGIRPHADGINDIVVTDYNDKTLTIFYMNKTGVASIATIAAGNHPDGICIADLNKDGKNELIKTLIPASPLPSSSPCSMADQK